ncbi:MAG: hypothetical protein JXA92_09155 [candidate division Zixibacteria bacterium]|nr:hypothetical protein [candidate division Zixibacteria bacterium]
MVRERKKRRYVKSVSGAIVLLLIVFLSAGYSQDVATGQATGNVLTGLQVIATQDLQFGDLLQGVAKSVGRDDDANSGIFTIIGNRGSGISAYLTLPNYLALPDGSDRMPISFGVADCAIDTAGATPSTILLADGFIDEDPHNLPAGIQVGSGGVGNNETRIYLGGRVTPAVDQTAGSYAGDIICEVAYNGT